MSIPPEILAALQRPLQPNAPTAVPVPEMEPPEISGMPQVTMPANEAADPLLQSMRQQGVPRKPEGFFKRSLKSFLSGFSDELTRPEREFQRKQEETRAMTGLRQQQAQTAEAGMEPITLEGPDGSPVTIPVKFAGPLIAGGFRVKTTQMQQAGATQRTEIQGQTQRDLKQADIDALSELRAAQAELASARAEATQAGIDPNSAVFKQKERAINARIQSAQAALGLSREKFAFQKEQAERKFNLPTSATRTMAEAAPKVKNFVARIRPLIEQEAAGLGPVGSRWQEFMAGKIGAPNTEYTRLRTNMGLLTTLLLRMHVGARGGQQLLEHFKGLMDAGKQSPENLLAALDEVERYADDVSSLLVQDDKGKQGKGKVFSKSLYKKEYPNGNLAQAIAAAKSAGYEIVD